MNHALTRMFAADAVLLVVDPQERLLPAIDAAPQLESTLCKLIESLNVLEIPVLLTEHYPAGLGATCPSIRERCPGATVVEKIRFSACIEPVMQRLRELNRRQVIVGGVEAHVCVQQTVLDLLRDNYAVFVCADAIGSRRPFDRDIAIARMRQAGAVITTAESAIYELLFEAGTERFKKVLKIVR